MRLLWYNSGVAKEILLRMLEGYKKVEQLNSSEPIPLEQTIRAMEDVFESTLFLNPTPRTSSGFIEFYRFLCDKTS